MHIPIITIIIPIREMDNRDIAKRLSYALQDKTLNRNDIDFLVVDDGSSSKAMSKHKEACQKLDIKYHYIDSQDKKSKHGSCSKCWCRSCSNKIHNVYGCRSLCL